MVLHYKYSYYRSIMKSAYKSIVVKIGTNALLSKNETLHKKRLKEIVNQLAKLHEEGVQIVLVSSGAMGCARALVPPASNRSPVEERQLLAAIGQVELMLAYRNAFKQKKKITIAQVLATKDDFRSRQHYLNMKQCFEVMLKERVIPIVNENDVVSVEELMFTDNDELAGLVTSMIQADALIMLTCVDGVLQKSSDNKEEVISVIHPEEKIDAIELNGKSSFGRGGMQTKLHIAKKLSSLGIATHIANAKTEDVVQKILSSEDIGTTFLPKAVKRSNTQRWLASSTVKQQGSIVVDEGAARVITSTKPSNLLPIGIRSLSGEFEKGDVVSVCDQNGTVIGVGKAAYDSRKLESSLGKKGQPAFIRCAYFVPLY